MAPSAYPQTLARVDGRVQDQTGGVIPGATITVESAETGLKRTGVTGQTGLYRVPGLPPGPYQISVTLAGFQTETLTGVVLRMDQTAHFNFTLEPAGVEETVTVTGESPLVDLSKSESYSQIGEMQIQELPYAARRWVDLAMLTPGVSQDAIRGFAYRGNLNIGGGGRYYSNMFYVDGVINNWAEMGEPRQDFGMDAIAEFEVKTSNYKAEYGLATGGVLNVVTKSGTNQWRGSAFFYYRDKEITALAPFQDERPAYKRKQYGGTIGGPIIKDRTHFFFQIEYTDEDEFRDVETGGAWPEFEGTFLVGPKTFFENDLTKITHQLRDNQSLFGRFAIERNQRPINVVGGNRPPNASVDRTKPAWSLVLGHTAIISDSSFNEFRYQRAYTKYNVAAPFSLIGGGQRGRWTPGDFGEDRLSHLTQEFRFPSIFLGTDNTQMGVEWRTTFKNDFSYFMPDWGGSHQWKIGADVNIIDFAADSTSRFMGSFRFPKDQRFDPNDPSTYPTQYRQRLPAFADPPTTHLSFYVQDDWSPRNNVTFNLGLRWDAQPGSFGENLESDLQRMADVLGQQFATFPLPIPFHESDPFTGSSVADRGDWNNFGPRIGVAWDPNGQGKTNVHAAYGIFYDNVRILTNHSELTWHVREEIIINNPSFPDPLQGLSRDEFISGAPPNIRVLSNDMVNPYAHHVTAGVSQELTPDMSLSVEGTFQRYRGGRNTIDLNLRDPETGLRPFPQFARVDYGRSVGEATYDALLVKLDKRFRDNHQYLVSYTLADSEDRPVNSLNSDLFGFNRVFGPAQTDRRHRLVLSGMIKLPYDILVSAIADFRTPLPLNPTTSFDLNGDGRTADLPPGVGYRSGCRDLDFGALSSFRASRGLGAVSEDDIDCPNFSNIDLRFSKRFHFGDRSVEFLAQVLNLFSTANFDVATSNPTSSNFGNVFRITPFVVNAPSRQAEFALRFQF